MALSIGTPLAAFQRSCRDLPNRHPGIGMLVWPGLHLFGDEDRARCLEAELPAEKVHRVRREGTAGITRRWVFFRPGDASADRPAYQGSLDPASWNRD